MKKYSKKVFIKKSVLNNDFTWKRRVFKRKDFKERFIVETINFIAKKHLISETSKPGP